MMGNNDKLSAAVSGLLALLDDPMILHGFDGSEETMRIFKLHALDGGVQSQNGDGGGNVQKKKRRVVVAKF